MPELPEVETVRRGMQPILEGSTIERLELRRSGLRFPFSRRFAARLKGRRIASLRRRAKYLLADLDDGTILLMHLGMSGSFRIVTRGEKDAKPVADDAVYYKRGKLEAHDHVVFHLNGGTRIVYNDPRRFGFMLLIPQRDFAAHPMLAGLGSEPIGNELSAEALAPRFAKRAAPLKAILSDQRVIAGLGNIYVCEALWRARLSPKRASGTLVRANGTPTERLVRLVQAVRAVIADAVEAGGSSLRDYVQANGERGLFQHQFSVYDREGEKCPRGDGTIRRIVQSGRSTFYCPACQR
ncbi:MAG TPA: bifunctional DNA-formamidopyrimidine glycosylase/DNA-(apurinic or apyrimidinic site) lyase [Casimicrobiaceae bacterium]|nr:bifunctional DNA-formamidopyrimidine glycosylase/DNA-(apurinic or apyrimidinic site) lyase [Casimicrobiaceae bacterium]